MMPPLWPGGCGAAAWTGDSIPRAFPFFLARFDKGEYLADPGRPLQELMCVVQGSVQSMVCGGTAGWCR